MPPSTIPLTRMKFRVTRALEVDDGDRFEIGLTKDNRQSTIYVDDQHVAASLSIGSTIFLVIEAEV